MACWISAKKSISDSWTLDSRLTESEEQNPGDSHTCTEAAAVSTGLQYYQYFEAWIRSAESPDSLPDVDSGGKLDL